MMTSSTTITVDVELRYQPIALRWAQHLAGYDAPEAKLFVGYFNDMASPERRRALFTA